MSRIQMLCKTVCLGGRVLSLLNMPNSHETSPPHLPTSESQTIHHREYDVGASHSSPPPPSPSWRVRGGHSPGRGRQFTKYFCSWRRLSITVVAHCSRSPPSPVPQSTFTAFLRGGRGAPGTAGLGVRPPQWGQFG